MADLFRTATHAALIRRQRSRSSAFRDVRASFAFVDDSAAALGANEVFGGDLLGGHAVLIWSIADQASSTLQKSHGNAHRFQAAAPTLLACEEKSPNCNSSGSLSTAFSRSLRKPPNHSLAIWSSGLSMEIINSHWDYGLSRQCLTGSGFEKLLPIAQVSPTRAASSRRFYSAMDLPVSAS